LIKDQEIFEQFLLRDGNNVEVVNHNR